MSSAFEESIRKSILEKLSDLEDKIKNNVENHEGKLDLDTLVDIDDYIDKCLNIWYY